ncbi:MAG: hypothetical protein AB1638_12595 [Nitrospirota bacterium]
MAKRVQRSPKNLIEVEEKVAGEIRKRAVKGRLSCRIARMIAEELNIPYKTVGKIADSLNVKISDCQLGCF